MPLFGNLNPQGMFGNMASGISGNPYALLMGGMGMLSGSNPQEGFQNAMMGIRGGSEMDQNRRDRKKQAEALQALHEMLTSAQGPMAGTDPATARYLESSPDAANSVLTSRMTKDPKDRDIRNDSNGVPRYVDTGDAVYPSDRSASGGTEFFSGRSPQAQALNYLINHKKMTEEEAANYAAMHFGTGPNGEIIPITPGGMQGQPNGSQQPGGGMSPLTGPKLSEDMRKASGFASRASAAEQILADPAVAQSGQSLSNRIASGLPLGNYVLPEAYQQFDQAQRDFVNAVLRRESGAAISESEFQNARKQYFPQPGDGQKVIEQKARNRALAIGSLQMSGQPAPTFGAQQDQSGWQDLGNGVRIREMQ